MSIIHKYTSFLVILHNSKSMCKNIRNPDSILLCSSASGNPEKPDKATEVSNVILANQTAYNVSKLLDSLLQDYDNSLRPDFAGKTLLKPDM